MNWSRGSDFVVHPEGVYPGVLTAWKGEKHDQYGEQVRLTFETSETKEDGTRLSISTWTKPSLHEKGRIAKYLKAIGIDPDEITDEELADFSLDPYMAMKRKVCLVIEHEEGKDGPKAKIVSIQPWKKPAATAPPESAGDRQAQAQTKKPAKATAAAKAAPPADPPPVEIDWDEE